MFISTGQFVHDVLPGMMRGKKKFRVLMTNYNDLDIPPAPLGQRQRGLEITVRSGGLEAYAFLEPKHRGETAVEQMERQASVAQDAVERGTDNTERYDLAVVYLGLTGFDKALMFALKLRRLGVASSVAVLTCDCDTSAKQRKLERLICGGPITSALLTPHCGGQADLEELYDGLLEVWPQVRAKK